ncbi:MAG: hypothetical protein JWN74_378 [Acidobacteriaceae bacterium]|nr:hypothetical protein [Acidobacteriaceae bacterium]
MLNSPVDKPTASYHLVVTTAFGNLKLLSLIA